MHHNHVNFRYMILTALVCGFLAAGPAQAHKVTVFAWVEGDVVHTQSKFMGSRMVKNGRIEVKGVDGNTLLEGLTDAEGRFAFTPPYQGDLDIVLHAGPGHQATWHLSGADFDDVTTGGRVDPPTAQARTAAGNSAAPVPMQSGLTEDKVAEIVSDQVRKEIAPIKEMLARPVEQSPSFRDIIGGIGYIFGLVGVVAYMQSRRREAKPKDSK